MSIAYLILIDWKLNLFKRKNLFYVLLLITMPLQWISFLTLNIIPLAVIVITDLIIWTVFFFTSIYSHYDAEEI